PAHRSPPQPARTAVAAAPSPTPPLRLHVIPRAAWTRAPVGSNINRLDGVNRITVHHAGGSPFWNTDARSTYRTLESIRGGHRSNGWADIGYHFIVDRDGRILEGRSLRYQGAHVKDNNEHNVGVMVLGNFNEQSPSARQLQSLNATLNALAATYQVPVHRVYTHRELGQTACPGRSLQAHMDRIRRTATLARG
ncbi:MAG: peptidoglycan recognition family protein, partial [Planctomycetota bacterium]